MLVGDADDNSVRLLVGGRVWPCTVGDDVTILVGDPVEELVFIVLTIRVGG